MDGHLPKVLLFLLALTLVVGWRGNASTGLVLCVWIPLGVLFVLLVPAAVVPSWERRWGSRIADHSAFVLR